MKHRILAAILALALILIPANGLAEAVDAYSAAMAGVVGSADDFYIDYIGESAIAIAQYEGSETNLILPEVEVLSAKIDSGALNLEADAIAYQAFAYNTALETLVIPEGYCHIKDGAFYGCSSLTTVVLPSTLRTISYEAFAHCTSLQHVIFPNGSSVSYLDETAFTDCGQMQMTAEEINDLIDTSVYEEAQAKEAQLAAFVVDENALVELAGYLATDMDAFSSMIGGSDWRDSDRWGYAIDELTVTSVYSWDYVEEIELRHKCNYSLCGIYVSMDSTEARNLMMKSGWKLDTKEAERMMFVDKLGNYLSFSFGADNAITKVGVSLNSDAVVALAEDTYDGSPVILLPGTADDGASGQADAQAAETVQARTTSDVNMRTGAGTGFDAICVVPAGSSVEYSGEAAADDRGVVWYCVRYNGQTGWCSSKYVELP